MDVCEYGKSNKIQQRNAISTNWSRHCLRQWVEVAKTYLIVEGRLERSTPGAVRQQVYLLFPAPPLQTTILADVNHRMSVISGTAQWRKVDEEKSSHWRKVGADQFPARAERKRSVQDGERVYSHNCKSLLTFAWKLFYQGSGSKPSVKTSCHS